jgi:predicted ATPase
MRSHPGLEERSGEVIFYGGAGARSPSPDFGSQVSQPAREATANADHGEAGMITHLHLENFKCLVDVTIYLAPFTVLIGLNESGKTSLLDAIRLLGRMTREPLPQVFSGPDSLKNLVTGKDATRQVAWRAKGTAGDDRFEYAVAVSPADDVVRAEELSLRGSLLFRLDEDPGKRGANVYTFFQQEQDSQRGGYSPTATALATSITVGAAPPPELQRVCTALSSTVKYCLAPDALRAEASPLPSPALTPSGDNLVAVIDDILTSPDREARAKLE